MTQSNTINFQGGFWIKKPSVQRWNGIKEIMPRHKVILENISAEGDKFFAIKSCYDKDIAFNLLQRKVDFKFYPDINLKVRLDGYYPKEALETINSQKRVLSDNKDIRAYFKQTMQKFINPSKYRWKPDDHVEQTLKALGLKKENCIINKKKGITIISDKSGKIIAKASPNSQRGYNYVYVVSHSDEMSQMLCVSYTGNVEHRFAPTDFKTFNTHFARNIKIDNGRKRPQG